MFGLDHAIELNELKNRFMQDLSAVGDRIKAAGDRALRSAGFRQGAQGWPDQFSPLVLLYPLLQAEPWTDCSVAAHPKVALAHLYQLISSIVEDRLLDQQIEPLPEILAFGGFCLSRSHELIIEAAGGRVSLSAPSLAGLYYAAQLKGPLMHPDGEPLGKPFREGFMSQERDAALRATPGFVAPLHFLRLLDQAERIPMARAAFAKLVVALQWLDDAEDYEEDLAFGRRNLLRECWTAATDPASARCAAARMAKMNACRRALELIKGAISLQSELGAASMLHFLRLLQERAERRLDLAVEDVAGQMALELAG